MQSKKTTLPTLTLVGIIARTSNKNEMDPNNAKIGRTLGAYFGQQLATKLQHRTNPGVTYCVYTEYESNEHGDYTYFVGEQVTSIADQDLSLFNVLTIPASDYQLFSTEPGSMPGVVINAWQKIWVMDAPALGGKRKYIADFELYDQRAADPNNTVVDIYIGIA